ncbi:hypothetical protein [Mycolicibacterium alvei]|uniref:Uncharacterized protein n=1 Tax=Mycolicibacterium alvei TaxID=67081 RepID=A0A6N4UUY5_9MYCO|nr:hypothetical protein [Mycolicibacterium alvei]MCV7003091.1 hypothetical protein [Mycolicibacterium alvei]BBX27464.1 hypothetical protein MALV_25890 [Mycolicibacterium alvei]
MCPSTDPTQAAHEFAAGVLQKLLRHIAVENGKHTGGDQPGHRVFRVSHAWTAGPMIYVVYQAPPLNITWGLVRDTRESPIDTGRWNDTDNPALYYYMLDFEEGWAGPLSPQPGKDPGIIRWRGGQSDGLPEALSDIPAIYRHNPTSVPAAEVRHDGDQPTVEPRRYADPP